MKFAHIADAHIGAWGEQKLRDLNSKAFSKAIEKSLSEQVDFILLSGDLFNTALPAIDCLKLAVEEFKRVYDAGIPVYFIAGSHDFSPSGKTMLDVLEKAGLMINVARGSVVDEKLRLHFVVDEKTGVKITGMIGKKGGLEKEYYKELDLAFLEQEEGPKIFMFHTALTELKPKDLEQMESNPVSFLPKGFDYYAGGHVHIVKNVSLEGYKNIVYPGPLFPNNFSEIEKLGCGGFYLYEEGKARYQPVEICKSLSLTIDCEQRTAETIHELVLEQLEGKRVEDTLVTLRFKGTLKESKVSDVPFKEIIQELYDRGAYAVLKNSRQLQTAGFEEIKISHQNLEEAEDAIIQEHAGQSKVFSAEEEKKLVKALIQAFNAEKGEGERIGDFEVRVGENADHILLQ